MFNFSLNFFFKDIKRLEMTKDANGSLRLTIAKLSHLNSPHLKLCIATATHNFKWGYLYILV